MASSSNAPGKLQCDPAHRNALPDDLRQNSMDCEKKIQTGKVKPVSPQEAIMQASGARKSGFPSITPHKRRYMSEETHIRTGRIPPKSNSQLVIRNPPSELPRELRPPVLGEKDATQAPLENRTQKEYIQEGQPMNAIKGNADVRGAQISVKKAAKASTTASLLRDDRPIVNSGVSVSPNLEIQIADPMSVVPLSTRSMDDNCLYVPASDASWKGSFNVLLNGRKQWEISVAIQAHPPSRVRRKVYEFSKLMPEVLEFELVQRGSLWMSLFKNYCPDRRDIGFYFFPSNPERCKNYMCLVEHIGEEDLVLRKYMDGCELLVFTSKILRMDCQRRNGMYFLWGLFGCSKLAIATIPEGDTNEVVDMEIDMMGGEDVGRLDIAVPRPPLLLPLLDIKKETCYDIPPGFEAIYRPKVGP